MVNAVSAVRSNADVIRLREVGKGDDTQFLNLGQASIFLHKMGVK